MDKTFLNVRISMRKIAFPAIFLFLCIAIGCSRTGSNSEESTKIDSNHSSQQEEKTLETNQERQTEKKQAAEEQTLEPESISPEANVFEEKHPRDWPKPQFALILTGRQHGYIEPCGCTGLSNQKGGLSRRHRLVMELSEKGWSLVPLDVGNQIRRTGRQPEMKFHTTINGLKKIGYQAIGYGPDDLRLSSNELLLAALGIDDESAPFISANVNVLGETKSLKIVEKGGKKIGITAILGKAEQRKVNSEDIELTPPEEALADVVATLKAENCDFYVLLSHASIEESKQLAQKFPVFDVVLTAGGAGEPTFVPESIPGTQSELVQVGTKGMYVGVIGVYDDEKNPIRYMRVSLDARFSDSPEILNLLKDYQQQLENMGFEGLELRGRAHSSGHQFVGSETCGECHTIAYEIWENTPHSHATESLVHPPERTEIPRHFDPECLSCHTTGWNAQAFRPYLSGYLGLEKTPHLRTVGCENCHGPGSAHVAAQNGDIEVSDERLLELQRQMRLPLEDAEQTCMKCHDLDNSPDFHAKGAFEKYWEKIKHEGKD